MQMNKVKATPIAKLYRKRCGNITFVVSSFQNPNTKSTANDLILSMLQNKVKERMAV